MDGGLRMDDELKAMLIRLMDSFEKEAAKNAAFRVETRTELLVVNARLDEMGKRFDDQLRIMAALIPNRIAAVPPAA